MVLQNLSEVLIIAYPLILIVPFLIARFIAGRSIKPISSIIETSNIITKDNLSSEFHYLKIEMSSMFCPKQLIIYLTESKTQSKEKRIHV
jgi:sensor histidine kinase YesM